MREGYPIKRPKFEKLKEVKLPKPEVERPDFNPELPEVKFPKPEVKRPKLTPELPKADTSKVNIEGIRKYIKEKIGGKLPTIAKEGAIDIEGKAIEEGGQKKIESKEDVPEGVKNFFEVRNKIEDRWRKKMGKAEDMPEAVKDFFKQLDKIDERWQKNLKNKEGVPGAAQDFFKQLDKIEDRWRKKMEKKEEVPEVVREFFEQLPERPLAERPPTEESPIHMSIGDFGREMPAPEVIVPPAGAGAEPAARAAEPERVRRPPVRIEEEDIFGKTGKRIATYERESLKKYELSLNEKKGVAKQLEWAGKDVMEDFDVKWYIDNRDKVEAAHFQFNPSNMEHVKMVVARFGGHNEMNQYRPESLMGEELPTYLEKLKQIESLEKNLYKEIVPPDSQALIFNLLQKRAERIKGRLGKKENKELFEVRKILGKNTEKMFSGEEMTGGFWGWNKTWERKMGELNMDLDMAIGFTEAKYAAVKDGVVTEFIEKELKKKPVFEATEAAFKRGGRDPIPFIDKIVHRRGLEGLTGGWGEDKRLLGDFLRAEEIDLPAELLDEANISLESRGMSYEKAVREQKGFVDWLFNLIFQASIPSSQEAERR